MREGQRSTDLEADDLIDAPFLDEAERAESAWLLARENDSGAPAPSLKIGRDHDELEDLLTNLPMGPPDESWHDEVLRLAASLGRPSRSRQRRRIYRWALAGTFVAAAAMAVVVLRPRPRADELEVVVRSGDPARGDAKDATVGDRLIIRARPRGVSDLRVYRADGVLVARCPGGPGCTMPAHGDHSIEIRLDAPVQYHVILIVGMTGNLPIGTMDAYLAAARAANARIITYPPIDVR
jgi:hypothetical protein